jgi:hypothetical protein
MRVTPLIVAVVMAIFGAFRLYRAFQTHGDFFDYGLGVICIVCGVVMFAKFFPSPKGKQES